MEKDKKNKLSAIIQIFCGVRKTLAAALKVV